MEDKCQWTLEHSTKAKARTKDTKERTKEKATASMARIQAKEKESMEESNNTTGKHKDIQLDKEKGK